MKAAECTVETRSKPSVFADPENYPGIVLRQPYAGLMRLGLKTIETRKRPIKHRGPLVIIAGLGIYEDAVTDLYARLVPQRTTPRAFGEACRLRGVAVALVDVVDCRPLAPEDEPAALFYEPGRWAWITANLRALRPFAVKGIRGFVRVPRVLVDAAVEVSQ